MSDKTPHAASGWTFTQLGGSKEQIRLDGYAAPFGRPRAKPVVEPAKSVRNSVTRYPGNSGAPTRHFFGTMQHDFELSGRWMDRHLGKGTANAFVQRFQKFVEDNIEVRITWGSFLSYVGFVESIAPKWESEGECSWIIKLLIDSDDTDITISKAQAPTSPAVYANEIDKWLLGEIPQKRLPSLDAVVGELFDLLDDAISNVSALGAAAVGVARTIDSFEQSSYQELQRLRSGLHQFKTAVISVQNTIDNIAIDKYVIDRQAEDDLEWLGVKTRHDVKTTRMLGTLAQMELAIDSAARGRSGTTYTAKSLDSWESISMTVYGDASGADRIRQANGIKYGAIPVAGRVYQISR